ncbi:hypothetical protein Rumeso_00982 [Rubellimicrobium mesophilum DSM 19309]|uniref:Uncharacterized protein n=1 Tax=Rubellimicrobium mesophilum DSM 19309 TaxID=442562 RepID=A0A017HTE6_9RHOB|nr:hypothetical protein Rumeso_00982 [Rubellimicrobium mesophilum DSM 19309]
MQARPATRSTEYDPFRETSYSDLRPPRLRGPNSSGRDGRSCPA